MPDFLIANLLTSMLDSMYMAHHANNDFHGSKAYYKPEEKISVE